MADFLMSHGSYLGIIIFMILTGAGLPLPEEVAIVAAGVLSSLGQLDPWLAVSACLFGALAGDCVMYWIGHHFGHRVLREHHWWNRFVKPEREAQMEKMLGDHAFKVLFLARFLVGLRSPVYLSAGILRLPFRRFILIDLVCATMVISTFFWLSYFIGDRVYRWIQRGEWIGTGIVAMVLVGVGIYLWRRHVRRAAARSATPPEPSAEEGEKPAQSRDEPNDEKGGPAAWPGAADDPCDLASERDASDPLSESATIRRTP